MDREHIIPIIGYRACWVTFPMDIGRIILIVCYIVFYIDCFPNGQNVSYCNNLLHIILFWFPDGKNVSYPNK